MHEIYIIMQMYALELGSYGIIKLLTNTGFFPRMCVYDAIMPFWHRIYISYGKVVRDFESEAKTR